MSKGIASFACSIIRPQLYQVAQSAICQSGSFKCSRRPNVAAHNGLTGNAILRSGQSRIVSSRGTGHCAARDQLL